MLINKLYLIIILSLIMANSVFAQFDIRLTSAYGKLSLKTTTGPDINADPGSFFTTGFQADYYLSENFGIGIGLDYFIKSSDLDVKLSEYAHSYKGMDNWEADPISRQYEFIIRSNSSDIVEQNTISFLEFPVSSVWRLPIKNDLFLVTRLGLKAGIAQSNHYRLKSSDLYTRLYFEEWDLELFDVPAHGLYDSRTDWHPEGDLEINTMISAFYELGIDYHFSMFKVRLSGYFSYSLNDMIPEKNSSLIYWRENYNPILTLPEKVSMMQVGIKLGIGLVKIIHCPWEYASVNTKTNYACR